MSDIRYCKIIAPTSILEENHSFIQAITKPFRIIKSSRSSIQTHSSCGVDIMQNLLEGSFIIHFWIYYVCGDWRTWSDAANISTTSNFCITIHPPACSPWVLSQPIFLLIIVTKTNNQKWVRWSWCSLAIIWCTIYPTFVWKEVRLCIKHSTHRACKSDCFLHLLFVIHNYPLVTIRSKNLNSIHWVVE